MQHALQVQILQELIEQLDTGKNIDAGVSYRMGVAAYTCPDRAALERDQFFQDHPQLIGLSGDLPDEGSYFTRDDFGTPVLATRDKQGKFRAFLNACRHRSVRVASEERGRKSVFVCPFHNWSYANTGDLLAIPDEDHFGRIDKSCHGLLELPAVERDGLLWVHPKVDGELDIDRLLGAELTQELASYDVAALAYADTKTIEMRLNWKLANDTFGETYHFGKLHKNTLGQLYYGNNLHLREFGRHHRFVTANRGLEVLRQLPESEWNIHQATFVMYYLFPNIQLIVSPQSVTLIRIYPDQHDPSRSATQVDFYFAPGVLAVEPAAETGADRRPFSSSDVYDYDSRRQAAYVDELASSLEVFRSTVEHEDYVMGEMQQRAAENGQLKHILFGRNEPALHHFHSNFQAALGEAPLETVD